MTNLNSFCFGLPNLSYTQLKCVKMLKEMFLNTQYSFQSFNKLANNLNIYPKNKYGCLPYSHSILKVIYLNDHQLELNPGSVTITYLNFPFRGISCVLNCPSVTLFPGNDVRYAMGSPHI